MKAKLLNIGVKFTSHIVQYKIYPFNLLISYISELYYVLGMSNKSLNEA
jgi:hypothetical protein